jgi:hypothetical protein
MLRYRPFQPASLAPLVVFRLIFGSLTLFGTLRFLSNGWVDTMYIEPTHFFGFYGFEWVRPLPGNWMYLPFILMIIGSLCILLGMLYRWGAVLFFLSFTYVELLDKTNYLNHYYFISLIGFLLIFLPANQHFSLDRRFGWIKEIIGKNWHTDILKFQLCVVYFFAGIAKLNSDWLLEAQPLATWLQAHHHLPLVGALMDDKWLAYSFSWFGCAYDLCIPFVLLSNRLRPFGYSLVVVFHLITWLLFPIGVFPWVMIFSTIVFFSATFHEKLLKSTGCRSIESKTSEKSDNNNYPWVRFGLITYLLFQLLVPVRYLLYPGHLFWHEEGFRFSWRVMLMHKEGYATFYVRDRKTRKSIEINHSDFLTPIQLDQVVTQPDMLLQYAKIIYSHYNGRKLTFGNQSVVLNDPLVQAEVHVSLNGRPSQLFVNPEYDLVKLPYDLKHRTWLAPFQP